MSFQVGDVVMLKSGGPLMTVSGPTESGALLCKWFHDSEIRTGVFQPAELEKEV